MVVSNIFFLSTQAEREKRDVKTMEDVERLLSQNGGLEQQERDRIIAEYKESMDLVTQQMAKQKHDQVISFLFPCCKI